MTWTDMAALLDRIRRSTSREEALRAVHEAPCVLQTMAPAQAVVSPQSLLTAAHSRAVEAVCCPGPARARPRPRQMPLFQK